MKLAMRRAFTVLLVGQVVPAAVGAQAAAAPLDYGAHDVGFTVVEALDSTRAFRPLRDFRMRMATETARPVQVSIWYPAEALPMPPGCGRASSACCARPRSISSGS